MDCLAPPLAFGFARVVSGGHACAHAPEQWLRRPVSLRNRYRVRPCESTRIVPSELLRVLTTVCLAAAVATGAPACLPAAAAPDPARATAARGMMRARSLRMGRDTRGRDRKFGGQAALGLS